MILKKMLLCVLLSINCVFWAKEAGAQREKGTVKANGIEIAYESFGAKENETILLISGTNAQLTMWPAEFCEKLVNKNYRVIRFDNRDVGLTTKFDKAGMPDWAAISKALQEKNGPPLPYSLDDMADDAVGLLEALGIEKAHIVGASMGAMIAQRIAYNHPEHTLSLTSIMAGGGNAIFPLIAKPDLIAKIPPPGATSDTAAYISREVQSELILAGSVHQPNALELLQRIKADVKRSYYPDGLNRQAAAALVGFYAGRQEQLKSIKVNAVVVHGDEDPIVPLDAARDVYMNIPGAQFEMVKGMGHSIAQPFFDALVIIIIGNIQRK